MKLADLQVGQNGMICAVDGESAIRRRLLDMGLTPNTEVYVRKLAPLGDPMQIFLRGYELTLRKAEAANIEVEVR